LQLPALAFEGGDAQGVTAAHLLGEIVVQRPAKTGSRDKANAAAPDQAALPAEQHSSGHYANHAGEDAPVKVLAKDKPGDQGRQHAFQVEHQGGGGGSGQAQARSGAGRSAERLAFQSWLSTAAASRMLPSSPSMRISRPAAE